MIHDNTIKDGLSALFWDDTTSRSLIMLSLYKRSSDINNIFCDKTLKKAHKAYKVNSIHKNKPFISISPSFTASSLGFAISLSTPSTE